MPAVGRLWPSDDEDNGDDDHYDYGDDATRHAHTSSQTNVHAYI